MKSKLPQRIVKEARRLYLQRYSDDIRQKKHVASPGGKYVWPQAFKECLRQAMEKMLPTRKYGRVTEPISPRRAEAVRRKVDNLTK